MSDQDARRLILHMSVSLDGFAAREDGTIDWLSSQAAEGTDQGARRHQANLELLGRIGTIVMGRGGYEDFERGWSGSDNPMAKLMNGLPKVVFSRSLTEVTWNNARISREPLETAIPALKREPGDDIAVFGGARIANSLIGHRLVDEYRLTIHPVALGRGLPLMHGLAEAQRFAPVSSTAYSDGCLAQVFEPQRS